MQCTFPYPLQPNTLTCTQPADEFQVNTDTASDYNPMVVTLKNGDFVVAWRDSSLVQKIHGQRYDCTGIKLEGEFQINTDTASDDWPHVAALNDGGFVVVWQHNSSPAKIHGQRYDSTGVTAGVEFQINTDTAGDYNPTVAVLSNGGFVIVWWDNSAAHNIHGQRYDSAGTAAGEFQVNTDTLSDYWPTVAALNDGGFLMAHKLESKRAQHTAEMGLKLFSRLPTHARKSATLDNGVEFAKHTQWRCQWTCKKGPLWTRKKGPLRIDTYFCDPYASWQKEMSKTLTAASDAIYPEKQTLTHSPRRISMTSS